MNFLAMGPDFESSNPGSNPALGEFFYISEEHPQMIETLKVSDIKKRFLAIH